MAVGWSISPPAPKSYGWRATGGLLDDNDDVARADRVARFHAHLFDGASLGGRGRPDGGQVEHVFDPFGRVRDRGEVGVLEDGEIGRDRRGHALDLHLA